MFNLDTETGAITIPQGDTALFKIILKCNPLPEGAVAVFGVCTAGTNNRSLLTKVFDVRKGEIIVRLTNRDTRDIRNGNYLWDARIVTDPDRDPETNEVRANDPGDNVYSIFSGSGGMPPFNVTGVAANV